MEKKTIWILPESAADTIMETLSLDARRPGIEPDIRAEISEAVDRVNDIGNWKVSDLINTIKEETRPIEGHTDPGAIEDCWRELMELLEVSLRMSRKEFLK